MADDFTLTITADSGPGVILIPGDGSCTMLWDDRPAIVPHWTLRQRAAMVARLRALADELEVPPASRDRG